jgi:hypothetical protein
MRIFLFSFFALLNTLAFAQGVQYEYQTAREDGTTGRTVMFVNSNFVKIDGLVNLNGATVLFNKEKNAVYLIDHKAKTYIELVKSEVENMNEQLAAFKVMLDDQAANFPPDQLDLVREMTKENGYAVAAPKVSYKKGGSSKVGEWKCTQYNGTAYNKTMVELHATKLETLELKESDLEILNAFSPYLAVLIDASLTSKGFAAVFCPIPLVEGLPVKSIDFLGGKAIITTTLSKVERKELDNSFFALPQGYTKTYFELGY